MSSFPQVLLEPSRGLRVFARGLRLSADGARITTEIGNVGDGQFEARPALWRDLGSGQTAWPSGISGLSWARGVDL